MPERDPPLKSSVERARTLRRDMTEPERLLWAKLRSRRFAGFKFRRQVPIGSYYADFVCMSAGLIIELDGGQHTVQRDYDVARTRCLESEGFRVVRIWNHWLYEERDAVDELIVQALEQRKANT